MSNPILETSFLADSPAGKQWSRIGIHNHHGMVIPLFSIRSQNSCGIGEYLDLIPLIDWCHQIGFSVIQLLPLNDNGKNPSPYSTLSAYALNPLHLSLYNLPFLEEFHDLKEMLQTIPKFSSDAHIPYPSVQKNKEAFLLKYVQRAREKILASENYRIFISQAPWLRTYAAFKALKIHFNWKSWMEWPLHYQNANSALLDEIEEDFKDAVQIHSIIQFLCFEQLKKVKEYAESKQLFIMGDIPILTDRDSADVWLHRNLFDLNLAAGAPPDHFNDEGQNWGFPLYNWDQIAQDHYRWWYERLQYASNFYQIYRIDHIVGLFRIWGIPRGKKTKEGHFCPKDPAAWLPHGKKILLEFLKASSMLPIGEDLGVVPPEVRTCLHSLGISGMKVIRWERDWDHTQAYMPYDTYPPASLTTVSTHDTEPLGLWWKNQPQEAMEFCRFKGWHYQPTLNIDELKTILFDSHHTPSLFHINLIQEYLQLVPSLSWPTFEQDVINYPGIISDKNWSYRIKPSIEELTTNMSLMHLMREIIA